MIEKQIQTEFGTYTQTYNHGYPVHTWINCINAYNEVPENQHRHRNQERGLPHD